MRGEEEPGNDDAGSVQAEGNEMANQELIWRKVYAIKTNSTV